MYPMYEQEWLNQLANWSRSQEEYITSLQNKAVDSEESSSLNEWKEQFSRLREMTEQDGNAWMRGKSPQQYSAHFLSQQFDHLYDNFFRFLQKSRVDNDSQNQGQTTENMEGQNQEQTTVRMEESNQNQAAQRTEDLNQAQATENTKDQNQVPVTVNTENQDYVPEPENMEDQDKGRKESGHKEGVPLEKKYEATEMPKMKEVKESKETKEIKETKEGKKVKEGKHGAGPHPVPIGEHHLPPLPYAYDALEPYIDEKTMHLHHDEHHLAYVEGLNRAEKEMQKARKSSDYSLIKHWEREAAFNGAGHYLHTIFWNIMTPNGGGKATGSIAEEINRTFGSYQKFKEQFSEAAKKVEGGGWAMLIWAPRSLRVEILQAEKHQNLSQQDMLPLLVLDVWEHAYYLKYNNNRGDYVDAWWNVVNWETVNDRYLQARKVKWHPY